MGASMTAVALRSRLERERIVSLTRDDWMAVAPEFTEIERHATGVAGDLVIVRAGSAFAAVEQPTSDQCVIRRLPDDGAVRAFVGDRLASYERMWDGCGCKVDYFA
jgi:hypothetical protein